MKYLIKLLILLSSFSIGFLMTNCTNTIYEEVVKYDTIQTVKYVDRIFNHTDTSYTIVEVPVNISTATDTVVRYITVNVPVIDSIFIETEKLVTKYDTITLIEREIIYRDTLYSWYSRSQRYIPPQLLPVYYEFWDNCAKYGWPVLGDALFVDFWEDENIPFDLVTSFTLPAPTTGQWIIMIKETLTYEQMYTPFVRELARKVTHKAYSTNADDIMNPYFPTDKLVMTSSNSLKKKYFDKLFAK